MTGIWAIILAAGESKRMGSPKMILPFRGRTVIGAVIENILASDVEKVMTVLGADMPMVLKEIEKYPVMHCYNADYIDGMLSSVKCGFRHIPDDFHAALVFPGDQPLIVATVVNLVINAYLETGKGIVMPVFEKKRGHPLLVDTRYRDEILRLDEPDGLRGLARKHPDDVLEVEMHDRSILKDIDTREDYLNVLREE
jgi:molybdenum cofactor cytidylyltransferase